MTQRIVYTDCQSCQLAIWEPTLLECLHTILDILQLSYTLPFPELRMWKKMCFEKLQFKIWRITGKTNTQESQKGNKAIKRHLKQNTPLACFQHSIESLVSIKDRLTSSADSSDRGPMSCKEWWYLVLIAMWNYLCGKHSCGSPLGLLLPLHCSQSCGWGTRRFAVTWRDLSGYYCVPNP